MPDRYRLVEAAQTCSAPTSAGEGGEEAEDLGTLRELERLAIEQWTALLLHPAVHAQLLRAYAHAQDARAQEMLLRVRELEHFATSTEPDSEEAWHARVTASAAELHAIDADGEYLEAAQQALVPDDGGAGDEQSAGSSLDVCRARAMMAAEARRHARNRLVLRKLGLVAAIARRYHSAQLSLSDLIQEGTLGLMRAIDRFDCRFGCPFSVYASWWIRHAIGRAVADKGHTVRIPVHMMAARSAVKKVIRVVHAAEGSVPSSTQIAAITGLPLRKIEAAAALPEKHLSLDVRLTPDEPNSLGDLLNSETFEDPVEQIAIQKALDQLWSWMHELGPLELQILTWRFGLNGSAELSLREIADRYSVSRERIRQLQEQALSKIRSRIEHDEAACGPPDTCLEQA